MGVSIKLINISLCYAHEVIIKRLTWSQLTPYGRLPLFLVLQSAFSRTPLLQRRDAQSPASSRFLGEHQPWLGLTERLTERISPWVS